jgi:exodeoxyribonuclease V alpha subunit
MYTDDILDFGVDFESSPESIEPATEPIQEEKDDTYYQDMTVKVEAKLSQVNFPKSGIMPDYGFSIVKLDVLKVLEGELHPRAKDKRGRISLKGVMGRLEGGEVSEFTIQLESVDPIFGATYQPIFKKKEFNFEGTNKQIAFFESFLTEKQINNIFEKFDNPIEILKSGDIQSLCDVKGIGEDTANKILKRYEENEKFAQAFIELAEYNLTPKAIRKLCTNYGSPDALIKIVKENPYVLVEVDGFGFKKADNIALQGGLDRQSVNRVKAFINHVLNTKGQEGYSWIDSSELLYEIEENLGDVEMEIILEAVNDLKEKGKIWNEERGKVGSMGLYELENKIVDELFRLINAPKMEIQEGWEDRVRQAEILQGWEYEEEQRDAIKTILENNVCIVTGYGGTGKSSTVLGALKALGNISFGQCALSGKASARLEEVTGYKSQTIHRLLGFKKGVFMHNEKFPILKDVIILDESSMLGGSLFYSLLQAIKTGSKLIMMGDTNQIPPLNSLNVFYDCLESGVVPSVKLTEIHRQAKRSAIITESIKISRREQLVDKTFEGKETRGELEDLHIDVYDKSWKTFDKVIEAFKEKMKIFKDVDRIQVIVPFNLNGDVSVYKLNKSLQEICNPASPEKNEVEIEYTKDKTAILREGDKVMNIKNNYNLKAIPEEGFQDDEAEVFNGYIGTIKKIKYGSLFVHFPIIDKLVLIPRSHWEEEKAIQHAWVCTCHKFQGSQEDYVIVAIDSSHYVMLNSEWLYTAISRASKDCTLIAQKNALQRAVRTKESKIKQTFMQELLQNKFKEEK